jgi:hypothetical protein
MNMDGKEVVFSISDNGESTDIKVVGHGHDLIAMIGGVLHENDELRFLVDMALKAIDEGAFSDIPKLETKLKTNGDA